MNDDSANCRALTVNRYDVYDLLMGNGSLSLINGCIDLLNTELCGRNY